MLHDQSKEHEASAAAHQVVLAHRPDFVRCLLLRGAARQSWFCPCAELVRRSIQLAPFTRRGLGFSLAGGLLDQLVVHGQVGAKADAVVAVARLVQALGLAPGPLFACLRSCVAGMRALLNVAARGPSADPLGACFDLSAGTLHGVGHARPGLLVPAKIEVARHLIPLVLACRAWTRARPLVAIQLLVMVTKSAAPLSRPVVDVRAVVGVACSCRDQPDIVSAALDLCVLSAPDTWMAAQPWKVLDRLADCSLRAPATLGVAMAMLCNLATQDAHAHVAHLCTKLYLAATDCEKFGAVAILRSAVVLTRCAPTWLHHLDASMQIRLGLAIGRVRQLPVTVESVTAADLCLLDKQERAATRRSTEGQRRAMGILDALPELHGPPQEPCAICLLGDPDQAWSVLPCWHALHRDCLRAWFTSAYTLSGDGCRCPLCKCDAAGFVLSRLTENSQLPA
jgi:hypothetical protein